MLKQMIPQPCICGKTMVFPEGEVKAKCPDCGVIWELGLEGFWSTKNLMAPLVQNLAIPEQTCSRKSPKRTYENYPKSKRNNKKKGTHQKNRRRMG